MLPVIWRFVVGVSAIALAFFLLNWLFNDMYDREEAERHRQMNEIARKSSEMGIL